MIEKGESDDESAARMNVVSERRKLLEETSAKVQEEVRLCFEQLAKVLRTREKQLLRQVQAVHNQQLTIVQSNGEVAPSIPSIRVNLSRQRELQDSISKFGQLVSADRDSIVVSDAEPYKIEEYVEADKDHISFDKSIKVDSVEVDSFKVDSVEVDSIKIDSVEVDSIKIDSVEVSESPFDQSYLNESSEADSTLDNEITVIMNHNFSSSSDGLRQNPDSPEKNYSKELNCEEEAKTKENPSDEFDFSTKDNDSTDSASPTEISSMNKKAQDCEQHPKQIQQWLQQILVETETEPTIHEVEQFAEISKSRFKEFQFPLET